MRLKKFAAVLFLFILLSSSSYASDSVYITAPTFAPYSAGTVRREVLNEALNELNYIRSLIGVPSVVLNDDYNNRAQHGAVLLDALNGLSHTPAKPRDMSEAFYKVAYDAASHGNLSMGQKFINGVMSGNMSPVQSVIQCMDDSDSSNISRVGHRRWLMNPRMKKVGFGISTRRGYAVTYVIEEFPGSSSRVLSQQDYQQYLNWKKWPISREYITWPASSTPVEYFNKSTAWSVTPNSDVFSQFNSVSVRLTRKRDGKTWNFGRSGNNGYFSIADNSVAYDQCIIFRPDNIDYQAGDSFTVEVSGLTRKNGGSGNISYSVTFTAGRTNASSVTPAAAANRTQPKQTKKNNSTRKQNTSMKKNTGNNSSTRWGNTGWSDQNTGEPPSNNSRYWGGGK